VKKRLEKAAEKEKKSEIKRRQEIHGDPNKVSEAFENNLYEEKQVEAEEVKDLAAVAEREKRLRKALEKAM